MLYTRIGMSEQRGLLYAKLYRQLAMPSCVFSAPILVVDSGAMEVFDIEVVDHRIILRPDYAVPGHFVVHK